jgi:pimeloyl-ACP methyl ester carboxylesterase
MYCKYLFVNVLAALCFLELGSAIAQDATLPSAEPPYYRVRYEPGKQPGELIYGVSFTLWIPLEVTTLRGIIVHQHGCGEGACKGGQTAAFDLHWQALAKKHQCALLGPSYEQPDTADCHAWCDARNGSDQAFQQALKDLAKSTGHSELTAVPWGLWGHSGGATWAGTMLSLHPERIATAWLRSGAPRLTVPSDSKLPAITIPDAALQVPVMCNLGTKEGVTVKDDRFGKVWDNVEQYFTAFRQRDALICVSVDPHSSHDCGNQRYLAIAWFDAILSARLPLDSSSNMRAMPTTDQWIAPLLGNSAVAGTKFDGPKEKSVWLPNERVAVAWIQYNKDAAVADETPPPAPTNVRLLEGVLRWEVEADFESGLKGFVILRDGVELTKLPEKPANSIGRPIFQRNSYHDTPSQPLADLQFVDTAAGPGRKYRYSIAAINSVGLQSKFTDAVDPK